MTRRATLTAFALASALALAGLTVAGATDLRSAAFSLDVADNAPVASLAGHGSLCQGPITAQARFTALQAWIKPAEPLAVEVRDASTGRVLARGRIAPSPTPSGQVTVELGAAGITRGTRFSVCLRNLGAGATRFEGGPPTAASGRYEIAGRAGSRAIALLFLRSRPPSLLSLLPTVFRRASLFKLSWVGPWTFWLLLVALGGAFGLGAVAVLAAEQQDDDEPLRSGPAA